MVINKKAYLKTLEAVIAIIMVLLVMYTVIPHYKEKEPKVPFIVQSSYSFILKELSNDDGLRKCVVEDRACESKQETKDFFKEKMPPSYDYNFRICSTTDCLPLETLPIDKSIYMGEIMIASSGDKSKPKIVRLWIWQK